MLGISFISETCYRCSYDTLNALFPDALPSCLTLDDDMVPTIECPIECYSEYYAEVSNSKFVIYPRFKGHFVRIIGLYLCIYKEVPTSKLKEKKRKKPLPTVV